MKLADIYTPNTDSPIISFEFFPPKNQDDIETIFKENVFELLKYNPSLISVTSSSCGNKDINSKKTLEFFIDNTNVTIMPHLTCYCASKSNIDGKLDYIKSLGCENILALRGDEPKDTTVCYKDFRYASDLVDYIHSKTDFSIAVAGYPEGHIDSLNIDEDIENLKRKIENGGQIIITQLFFDNNKLFNYMEKLKLKGIDVPVIAGIMPILSFKQIEKMTSMARIFVPDKIASGIEKYKENSDDIKKFGVDIAINQCQNLIENGVKNLHFYTLNHSNQVKEILENI